MYYAPIVKLDKYITANRQRTKIYQIYNEEMFKIQIGQNWDINWHRGNVKPNEQQYY